ncbi:efflux RND transporter periplasmic adaptor subunit [Fluviicola taffensis]|uniref:Efflux transporter, RND family, MFP subunit n=1 Tax=Fluviicola taffensis (strain DSM 16823 / NCIMB 13979 / RW262) TaxID=755732 RepID=F2IE85_FLUTR|nr:efflux RND transporter periplasmic adaptor subunit [Fluviicola taffensis]AEA42403.1 efflux transporter, RND family, MFP subunit [Fluviicola taffensis DSM 16823]
MIVLKTNQLLTVLSLVILASCSSKEEAPAGDVIKSYQVLTLEPHSTTLQTTYPATLEGIENVDIHPKIDGFIDKIAVDEGQFVKKGQLLFTITAPQYEQLVRTARATVKSAEAGVSVARLQVQKTKSLVDKNIVNKYELQEADLTLQTRLAELAQAEANLVNANVNLGYTRISSPVDGVIGSLTFKTGSLVSSSMAKPLTTVSNISKIYAYFSMNEKQLLEFIRNTKGVDLKSKIANIPDVSLVLSDGSLYPDKGKIGSINGLINAQTGSTRIRATFSNTLSLLRSGGSAQVLIPQEVSNGFLIPQRAVSDVQGKKFVCLVDKGDVIRMVNIEVMEATSGTFFIVTKGVKAGDPVVLEGVQFLKDGVKIKSVKADSKAVYAELNQ